MLPAARSARVLVAAAAGSVAIGLTLVSIWLAIQLDAVLYLAQIMLDRARDATIAGLDTVFTSIVGDAAASALRASGSTGIALAAGAAVVAGALAAGALRAAISTSKRAR
jgi:hypothetical protein